MDAAGVLPGFGGMAVHDGWSPYWRYPVTHALCGAYLLRELRRSARSPGRAGRRAWPSCWWTSSWPATSPARAAGVQRVDGQARVRLQGRYARLLADGQAANPPPPAAGRGRTRRSPAARLLARLAAHREEVLRSLDDPRAVRQHQANATCGW
jgi:transposase